MLTESETLSQHVLGRLGVHHKANTEYHGQSHVLTSDGTAGRAVRLQCKSLTHCDIQNCLKRLLINTCSSLVANQ